MTMPTKRFDNDADASVPAGAELEPADEPPSGRGIEIDLVIEDGDWGTVGDVEELVHAAAGSLERHPDIAPSMPVAACVALSVDARLRDLNRQFRGIDKPTNVLSFPSTAPMAPVTGRVEGRFVGDVVIALETLVREAQSGAVPVPHHLQHLVIHGLLHLLGYDHEIDEEALRMEAVEIAALAVLGIDDPYTTPEQA